MGEERKPRGDSQLDAELSHRFRAPLMAYFLKRVRDRTEAEDLTQEAFVRLIRNPDRNDGIAIHAYVFTIAANLLRDRARSRVTRAAGNHAPLHEVQEGAASALIEDISPERVLVARQTLAEVLEALAEMGERTRDIFILSRLENLPQREIAALYGISVSAVEKHMIRAMAHLGARSVNR
ncbi:MAG TPA: sigma-70 family RNA polymerase sigma factor [Rhizomicrobium sp.]|jgi:RNA polymerase sigma-70 factor (ECF subfamily)